MNDFYDGPFVYDNPIDNNNNNNTLSTTEIKNEHLTPSSPDTYNWVSPNSAESIELEERGELGSSIFTVANVFTDAQCDIMVDYILKHSALWDEKAVGSETKNNVKCKYLTLKDMVSSNIPCSKELDDLIFKSVGKLLVKIRERNPAFNGTQDNGYTLRKIYGGTKRHIDGVHSKTSGFKNFVRCLSIIIVLNDDYDGGVFCFPNQGLKFRVQKGQAILFPPYWTHPHSVTSVSEGQARYTINTWILEKFID
jgi:hypothetical protein